MAALIIFLVILGLGFLSANTSSPLDNNGPASSLLPSTSPEASLTSSAPNQPIMFVVPEYSFGTIVGIVVLVAAIIVIKLNRSRKHS